MKWHSKGHLVSWWQSWNLVFLIVLHLLGVISSMARDSISNIKNIPWDKYSLKWTANPFTSWCNDLLIPSHAIYFQFIKRIPLQRLVIWKMRSIFSQDSGTCSGHGLRPTPGKPAWLTTQLWANSEGQHTAVLSKTELPRSSWLISDKLHNLSSVLKSSLKAWQFTPSKKHGNYFDS